MSRQPLQFIRQRDDVALSNIVALACVRSGYDKAYAHIRKSNISSNRIAEEAGFKLLEADRTPHFSMVW